ncbi:MAG: ribose 5-phosphate isomerase B, partial [Verrucomicrobiota bacterium]
HLLTSFGTSDVAEDIPDPIGQSVNVYKHVRDWMDGAIADMILHMVERGVVDLKPKGRITRLKIAVGTDHGGIDIKDDIIGKLEDKEAEVIDVGTHTGDSVDYPDFALEVARRVSEGEVDEGVLICKTGIGMSISANKMANVRAALCVTPDMARLARSHNNANILALGAGLGSKEDILAIVDAWSESEFEGGRHQRRVDKIGRLDRDFTPLVCQTDPEVFAAMRQEEKRQHENLELIASENAVSPAVRAALGGNLTNKYAEGYPKKRWYHGCDHVDDIEQLAIDRAKELFGAEHANVQAHSGSTANMGAYFSVLEPGDTILAMSLADGGHLTHGHPLNFSGRFFKVEAYGVRREDETIDYDALEEQAKACRPKLICAGASAYSRMIDFERLRKIADTVNALLMVDMAHIAGLVAGGVHPNPVPYSDFVTTTTHKTLRGPRGGMILCREKFRADLNKQIFPGIQGGPLMHSIAGKAVCLKEAMQPEFQTYAEQVVKNAQAMADTLTDEGLRVVSGGTDNHVFLLDLTPIDVTGKDASGQLDKAGITVNKNAIPFDTKSPFVASGIRIGTPTITTRGMQEDEAREIARLIYEVLTHVNDDAVAKRVRNEVTALTARFPLP